MSHGASAFYGSYGARPTSGASAPLPSTRELTKVFSQIDINGRGRVSKGQFVRAFENLNAAAGFRQLGAEKVFAALDARGTGVVSQLGFVRGMIRLIVQFKTAVVPGA